MKSVYDAIYVYATGMGKVLKSNKNAAVFDLGNEKGAMSFRDKDGVSLVWGNIGKITELDISKFEDLEDEVQNRNSGIVEYELAADSLVLDSAEVW